MHARLQTLGYAPVQAHLIAPFRRYGLPARLLMGNGAPWGDRAGRPFTPLTVLYIHKCELCKKNMCFSVHIA